MIALVSRPVLGRPHRQPLQRTTERESQMTLAIQHVSGQTLSTGNRVQLGHRYPWNKGATRSLFICFDYGPKDKWTMAPGQGTGERQADEFRFVRVRGCDQVLWRVSERSRFLGTIGEVGGRRSE